MSDNIHDISAISRFENLPNENDLGKALLKEDSDTQKFILNYTNESGLKGIFNAIKETFIGSILFGPSDLNLKASALVNSYLKSKNITLAKDNPELESQLSKIHEAARNFIKNAPKESSVETLSNLRSLTHSLPKNEAGVIRLANAISQLRNKGITFFTKKHNDEFTDLSALSFKPLTEYVFVAWDELPKDKQDAFAAISVFCKKTTEATGVSSKEIAQSLADGIFTDDMNLETGKRVISHLIVNLNRNL